MCSSALCFLVRRCSSPSPTLWVTLCRQWCLLGCVAVSRIIQVLWEVDPCALACTQGRLYEKFSLSSSMGKLFPPVLRLFLPVGLLVAILFSRIIDSKMVWHCSLLVHFLICFFLLSFAVQTLCVCILCHKTGLQWLFHPWKFSSIFSKYFYCAC